jgi:hypothetical protein
MDATNHPFTVNSSQLRKHEVSLQELMRNIVLLYSMHNPKRAEMQETEKTIEKEHTKYSEGPGDSPPLIPFGNTLPKHPSVDSNVDSLRFENMIKNRTPGY